MDKILLIKILYGAASLQGLLLVFLLVKTRTNQPANRILGLLLLLISFHLVLVGFDERSFFLAFPHLSRISWVIGTLYGPLVFLFIRQITGAQTSVYARILVFLPFIIVLTALIPYFVQTAAEKRAYLDAFELARQDDFGWINRFVSLVHIAFAAGNLMFYLRWEQRQSEEFSAPEAVRVQWLRQFLIFMLVVTLFGVSVFFARILNLTFLADFYRFHFIGVVFLFYWLSYKALTQPVLFGIVKQPAHSIEASITKRPAPADSLTEVFERVREVMENERLYLKNDLTLTELASQAGFARNQVSQAINTASRGNFFDFVNDFRVREFKRKATDPANRHLTQVGIAQESGFNSKASFYAVFKKKTGMTPAEFLESESRLAG